MGNCPEKIHTFVCGTGSIVRLSCVIVAILAVWIWNAMHSLDPRPPHQAGRDCYFHQAFKSGFKVWQRTVAHGGRG